MTYTVDSSWFGKGAGSVEDVINWTIANRIEVTRLRDLTAYLLELSRLCEGLGYNFDLAVAQSALEVANWTADSHWWTEELNATNIGIFDDGSTQRIAYASGIDAARAHITHLTAYTGGRMPQVQQWVSLDPRYQAVFDKGWAGTVKRLRDLGGGKWATDSAYASKIAAKANSIFHDSRIQNQEVIPVSTSPVIVPKIKAKECPIEIRVLTGPMVNRPALAMPDASFVTVHEVGNLSPGADEDMHADFVHNGGGENAVSFHFVAGPTKIIQLVYLNENAWHASDYYSGRGNRDSIAIETIQIGDFAATLSHLSWLIAEIYRNANRFAFRTDVGRTDDLDPALMMERTKQHNFWAPDQKNCPQFIRDRGLFPALLNAVGDELKGSAPAVKRYASPILPEWWSEQRVIDLRSHREDDVLYRPLGTRLVAIAQTGAYAHPWLPEGKGKRTRANIQIGEAVDVRYIANHPETGKQWGITRHGTWVQMDRFTPGFTIRTRKAA